MLARTPDLERLLARLDLPSSPSALRAAEHERAAARQRHNEAAAEVVTELRAGASPQSPEIKDLRMAEQAAERADARAREKVRAAKKQHHDATMASFPLAGVRSAMLEQIAEIEAINDKLLAWRLALSAAESMPQPISTAGMIASRLHDLRLMIASPSA